MKIATFSFDDGPVADQYLAELLRGNGICATFYLTASERRIGDEVVQNEKFVYWTPGDEEINIYRGHEIGCHGWSHRWMKQLSEEKLYGEIIDSMTVLSNIFGQQVKCLSYPYGGYDQTTLDFLNKWDLIKWARTYEAKPSEVNQANRFQIPVSMILPQHGLNELNDLIVAGEPIHIAGHAYEIFNEDGSAKNEAFLKELRVMINNLKINDYRIVPNSIFFEETVRR